MDAHLLGAARPRTATADVRRAVLVFLSLGLTLAVAWPASTARGAGYRTANFVVDAATPQLAKELGDAAERWRKELAVEWLGAEMPAWSRPCPIKATLASGAGGATSFVFDNGEVFDWRMNIQGSRERMIDSVLPHEVLHTIFASHFRQPLPRWADEGACTTVEHVAETSKQEKLLIECLHTRRGIPFSAMFAMTEYPPDVLPLYAQGYALAEYLIGQRGNRAFLEFLADGMRDDDWPRAVRENYGYEHLLALQNSWLEWIRSGRPELTPPADGAAIASTDVAPTAPTQPATISPTPAAPLANEFASAGWSAAPPAPPAGSVYDASASRGTVLRKVVTER